MSLWYGVIMIELKMILEGDQEKAFKFMVAQINEKRKVPYDEQEIFRQHGIFYIKRMLKYYLPVKIESELTAGMTDEQKVNLYSKVVLEWKKFVQQIISGEIEKITFLERIKRVVK